MAIRKYDKTMKILLTLILILVFTILVAQQLEIERLDNRIVWLDAYMDARHDAYRQERVFWCAQGIEVPPFICDNVTEAEWQGARQ